MAKTRKAPKDDKRAIPGHFQTWGDLMLNLLTLFILLCSFAKEKHAAFFAAGIGSFITNIESFGLPGLLPADTKPLIMDFPDDRYRTLMEPGTKEHDQESEYDSLNGIELERVRFEGEAWIPGGVHFQRGSAVLGDREKNWLREQLVFLRMGGFEIEVRGHAWQECVDREAEWRLSCRRAYAVIAYLNEVGGIPLQRMHAVGYGAFRPLSEGEQDPGLNRRVNIKLTKCR